MEVEVPTKNRTRYRKRKAAGLCVYFGCSLPPSDGKRACEEHQKYYAANARRYRVRRKAFERDEAELKVARDSVLKDIGELVIRLPHERLVVLGPEIMEQVYRLSSLKPRKRNDNAGQ